MSYNNPFLGHPTGGVHDTHSRCPPKSIIFKSLSFTANFYLLFSKCWLSHFIFRNHWIHQTTRSRSSWRQKKPLHSILLLRGLEAHFGNWREWERKERYGKFHHVYISSRKSRAISRQYRLLRQRKFPTCTLQPGPELFT